MTYSDETIDAVLVMLDGGMSKLAISKSTGISRAAIRDWENGRRPGRSSRTERGAPTSCAVCGDDLDRLPKGPYAYLLGLYLGDGCLATHKGGVYRLRVFCCDAYPDLMAECAMAMSDVLPNRVGYIRRIGCTEVWSYSKHWICMFPQHGPGMKHTRLIELADWQQSIIDRLPAPFIRGLIHSDGCRVLNWVNNTPYSRYHFTNTSGDIRALFGWACDRLGVDWRPNNATNLSVAKRASVKLLDQFIGPKH
jgi:hypothetical protein